MATDFADIPPIFGVPMLMASHGTALTDSSFFVRSWYKYTQSSAPSFTILDSHPSDHGHARAAKSLFKKGTPRCPA